MQPQQTLRDRLVVEQEAAKEQGKEHDKHAEQIRHTLVAHDNPDEQADHRSRQIEQHEEEHKLAKLRSSRHQAGHRVHDAAHNRGRQDAQGNNIEDDFGQVVG